MTLAIPACRGPCAKFCQCPRAYTSLRWGTLARSKDGGRVGRSRSFAKAGRGDLLPACWPADGGTQMVEGARAASAQLGARPSAAGEARAPRRERSAWF